MDIKGLYESGISYNEFIKQENGDYEDKITSIYDSINVEDTLEKKIKSIEGQYKILVFGELWCPDCVINVPALKKITELNENIEMSIVSRKGNEEYLEDFTINGKAKIPTFLIYDEKFGYKNNFIEQPTIIKNIMQKGDQVEIIVSKRKYRKGEYCIDTLKEIIDKL